MFVLNLGEFEQTRTFKGHTPAYKKAAAAAPSEPHEAVASPPAKVAACGLSAHPANASFVPRGVVVAPRAATTLAKPSSSSCVAGVTTLPAMRPYPTTAVAKRPFVVPPIAADGIIDHRAIAAATEPPYKTIKIQYPSGTRAMPPAAAAATAAIAAAAGRPIRTPRAVAFGRQACMAAACKGKSTTL